MKTTPPDIRILSEDVANRIAAGEVIERPAAVVKELLENAIDAGATRIDIEFKHGGKSFVKVLDNGCGMTREQALMSLEPHATSKIREPEDLFKISSYGFRGEAVPSIASVSKFTLRTRPEGSQLGTHIDIYAGEVNAVKDCGMAAGTEVIVENLFCSVPVRRKFLKTDNVEASHITKLCRLYALALPQLAITLIENSRVVFRSEQDLGIMDRIERVYGREISSKLMELKECVLGDLKVYGAILKPGESFATNRNVCSFINGRPVDSRAVYSAIKEAYGQLLPKGRYAAAFLFIEMDPASVDVNVHPAKREVRLRNEFAVRDFLLEAMTVKLKAYSLAAMGLEEAPKAEGVNHTGTAADETAKAWEIRPAIRPVITPVCSPRVMPDAISKPAPAFSPQNTAEIQKTKAEKSFQQPPVSQQNAAHQKLNAAPAEKTALPQWRYIGALKKRYALFETPKSMTLMNVSAAIKRVRYAEIMESLEGCPPQSQGLLIPISLKFERSDDECFAANRKAFEACGFEIEDFGKCVYRIVSVPAWVAYEAAENFIRDFVELARDENRNVKRELSADMFARLAVRRIGSAGFAVTEASAQALLERLLLCPSHASSPDGKPTIKEISEAEISRMFAL